MPRHSWWGVQGDRLNVIMFPSRVRVLLGLLAVICAASVAAPPGKTGTAAAPVPAVTYTREVAAILHNRCVSCHRSGEVGPFALDTYEQAKRWARAIKEQTQNRRMPPWGADSHGEFHSEARLTTGELALLAAWVDGGAARGSDRDMPPLVPLPPPGAWELGTPDRVFEMPTGYSVRADGPDTYRCFVLPADFTEDRYLAGVAYQPGNRSVVHHMSAFLDTSGQARKLAQADKTGQPGYTNPTPANGPGFAPVAGQLGGWTPGHHARRLPSGVGLFVPKGADIVLEVHYHPTGKAESDRSRIGLYFAKGEIKKRLRIGDVTNAGLRLPAGAADTLVEASAFTPDDLTLLSVTPHMHFLGRSMRVTAHLPDGTEKLLVDVPRYDFRWQPSYRFKVPVRLPRRTRIDVAAHFDNSPANPQNPHRPPKTVLYGEDTNDEMCSAFFGYTLDSEDLTQSAVLVPAEP